MPRPKRFRSLEAAPAARLFVPQGTTAKTSKALQLRLDEFEALRLADFEGLSQEQAARKMKVSRATFGRIVESARRTLAEALVQGCSLEIGGGAFRYTREGRLRCPRCKHTQPLIPSLRGTVTCQRCVHPLQDVEDSAHAHSRKAHIMDIRNAKIAIVTDEGNSVSSHFGRAPYYEVLTFQDGKVTNRERRDKFAPHHAHEGDGHHHHGEHDHDHGHRHQSMVESIRDCQVVVARGMGNGAYEHLTRAGLATVLTSLHTIQEVADAVASGSLEHQPTRIHHKHDHA